MTEPKVHVKRKVWLAQTSTNPKAPHILEKGTEFLSSCFNIEIKQLWFAWSVRPTENQFKSEALLLNASCSLVLFFFSFILSGSSNVLERQVYVGVRTCDIFLCREAIVFLLFIASTEVLCCLGHCFTTLASFRGMSPPKHHTLYLRFSLSSLYLCLPCKCFKKDSFVFRSKYCYVMFCFSCEC